MCNVNAFTIDLVNAVYRLEVLCIFVVNIMLLFFPTSFKIHFTLTEGYIPYFTSFPRVSANKMRRSWSREISTSLKFTATCYLTLVFVSLRNEYTHALSKITVLSLITACSISYI